MMWKCLKFLGNMSLRTAAVQVADRWMKRSKVRTRGTIEIGNLMQIKKGISPNNNCCAEHGVDEGWDGIRVSFK